MKQENCSQNIENNLLIANTCFRQQSRLLYMWTLVHSQYRNQVNYKTGSRSWRSYILSSKRWPGADSSTDCERLKLKIWIKWKKNTRTTIVPKYNLSNIPKVFKDHVNKRFSLPSLSEYESEELWVETRNIIKVECTKTTPIAKRK